MSLCLWTRIILEFTQSSPTPLILTQYPCPLNHHWTCQQGSWLILEDDWTHRVTWLGSRGDQCLEWPHLDSCLHCKPLHVPIMSSIEPLVWSTIYRITNPSTKRATWQTHPLSTQPPSKSLLRTQGFLHAAQREEWFRIPNVSPLCDHTVPLWTPCHDTSRCHRVSPLRHIPLPGSQTLIQSRASIFGIFRLSF